MLHADSKLELDFLRQVALLGRRLILSPLRSFRADVAHLEGEEHDCETE